MTNFVPRKTLSVLDAVAIIVGIVIGAGIFKTPSLIASNTQETGLYFLAWILGGAISLIGALCYAELATTYPHSGGDYHYLSRAYGRGVAFMFGWSRMSVIQPGSIALLAFVFGDYASQLLPPFFTPPLCAFLVIALITLTNISGTREGKWTQNILTSATVIGLASVILAGVIFAPELPVLTDPVAKNPGASFGLAMVFVLLTFGGWNEAAYISAELKGGKRDMVRALLWGIGIITAIYLLAGWAYLKGLGFAGMGASEVVAADLMRKVAGGSGAILVSLLIAVAVLGTINGTIFTGARTNYAVGQDFGIFSFMGKWQGKNNTAVNALLFQGIIASLLVLLGTLTRKGFSTMVDYTAPMFWFFFLLTGISLFVLRFREPEVARPFQVPLYPLTPLLFCAACLYMLRASLLYTGIGAMLGVFVFLLGGLLLLVSYYLDRLKERNIPG